MKNKICEIFLILILSLNFFIILAADEFIFEVSELEVTDNGNVYNGINKGKITTKTGTEITSENFEYLKKINQLQAYGDAQVIDSESDVKINAEQIFYLKNEEIIYTVGKTYVKISNTYDVEGYDLKFLRNKMILSSLKKVIIKDSLGNVYKLNEFEYSITPEILKGKKIQVITNFLKPKSDKYFFESGIFDFKNDKFAAKETSLKFHKTVFDDTENDPRLKSVISHGDEFTTYFEKGIFTSCKLTDKCPPWKIKSEVITHDRIKKQISYTNSWLSVFDVPVLYFPKFFHPDPSVKRQSGFLRPAFMGSRVLGNSTYTPYFYVIAEDKDITIKPRYFRNGKYILQNEYRQATENSFTIVDFSYAKGHDSSKLDKGDSRSHFFMNTDLDLDLDDYIKSELVIDLQKASNDSYLNAFGLASPLLTGSRTVLESKIELDLEHEDFNFNGSFKVYETLAGLNSDRYQYILPVYSFSKSFDLKDRDIDGSFAFNHSGNNTISSTNVLSTTVSNDLNFKSFDFYTDLGIKTNFGTFFKNLNSIGKNHSSLKSSPQSEIMTSYIFNTSLPLIKNSEKIHNMLEPKMSFRFSPHDMKNNKDLSSRITVDNIYGDNRLALGNSYEGGESLTIGVDYKKEKVNTILATPHMNEMMEIEDFFDFKLATVFRLDEEDNIPTNSTLNKKTSNIFGQVRYYPADLLKLDYDFSLKNDLDTMEYNSLSALFELKKFTTNFNFTESRGVLGDSNVIGNTTTFNFSGDSSLTFKTRRNRDIDLTEFYDLVYEYDNDCLIASVEYKKQYYAGNNIVPLEELFFSITIIPLSTFSPDKMILNKNRKD